MTEQEYIYVRDLSNILVMRQCLESLNPGYSVMSVKQHARMTKLLQLWQERLQQKITGEAPAT